MLYGMVHPWAVLILASFFLCCAGCVDQGPGSPENPPETPATVPFTTVQTPGLQEPSSAMALQPADLPSDFTLQDRSAMALEDVSPLAIELGWLQGYYVSFTRKNIYTNDITYIRQTVNVYSPENINGVYLIEKEEMKNQKLSPGARYEIPFPAVGTQSIAFRETNPLDAERPVTYTVIFTRKNVFEKITLAGTNTDYETLKRLAMRADALVQ